MTCRRALALTLALTFALGAGACTDDDDPAGPGDDSGEEVEPATFDLGAGLEADLPGDWVVEQAFPAPDTPSGQCEVLPASLGTGSGFVSLRLPEAVCADEPQDAPLNGDHGDYITIEDVPEPREVSTVEVPLGSATTFLQDYEECTQECVVTEDRVALVALDPRIGEAYPTLMVQVDSEVLSESEFLDLITAIRRS